jgi:hypothetical protein
MKKNKDYFLKVLSIERAENIVLNPRKDLRKYSDFLKYYAYFFYKPEDIKINILKKDFLNNFKLGFESFL